MATTLKLRTDIKKLKGALSSKSLPAPIKAKLKAQLDKAQNELKAMQSGAKPRKVSTTKGTKTALTSLQKLVNKKKFSVYQGKGIDLKKDADQGALAVGRRVSKGIKGNQFGDAKSSKGNVYYEYRANRLDVKQPKGKQKYPKLEDGGMMNEPKYDSAGFSREDDKRIKIYSGNKGKLNEIFNEYKNQKNELRANEVFDNEKMKGKSVFLFVNDDFYDQYVQDEDEESYADENFGFAKGGYMAKGGMFEKPIPAIMDKYGNIKSEKILQQDLEYLKEAYEDKMVTKAEYEKSYDEIKEQLKFLQSKEKGGYMAKGGEMKHDKLDEMVEKYQTWLDKNNLPQMSADELLVDESVNLTKEQRKYIQNFANEWDEEQDKYEKGGYMAKRGSIPNNYKGKTANEIWDEWTFQQKRHFLEDHYDEIEKYGGLTMGKSLRSVAESTYNDLPTNVKQVLEDHIETGQYAKGGVTEKEVVESNAEMVLSKIKEVHHHADELGNIVTNKSDIEAWVVAKIERASTDLSDITHYLDGQHEKMSMGGSINNYVHKMDKK